jgi:hypothetical protein
MEQESIDLENFNLIQPIPEYQYGSYSKYIFIAHLGI